MTIMATMIIIIGMLLCIIREEITRGVGNSSLCILYMHRFAAKLINFRCVFLLINKT